METLNVETPAGAQTGAREPFVTFCACGKPIAQLRIGRPRTTCSAACRTRRRRQRQRDVTAAQLRECRGWVDEWLELGSRGAVTAQQLAAEVRALIEDIDELRARLDGPRS